MAARLHTSLRWRSPCRMWYELVGGCMARNAIARCALLFCVRAHGAREHSGTCERLQGWAWLQFYQAARFHSVPTLLSSVVMQVSTMSLKNRLGSSVVDGVIERIAGSG